MMWVSSTMDRNKQEGNWLIIKCKALKRLKQIVPPLKDHLDKFPWQMRWVWQHRHDYNDYKIEKTQMHIMHEQRGWLVWCPHLLHKTFEIWPFFTLN
jgi:hypothetical protein